MKNEACWSYRQRRVNSLSYKGICAKVNNKLKLVDKIKDATERAIQHSWNLLERLTTDDDTVYNW